MKKSEFVKHYDKLRRCLDNQFNPKKKLLTYEFTEKMALYLGKALGKKNISIAHKEMLKETFGPYAEGVQTHGIRHAKV